jgi:hypothetical protein
MHAAKGNAQQGSTQDTPQSLAFSRRNHPERRNCKNHGKRKGSSGRPALVADRQLWLERERRGEVCRPGTSGEDNTCSDKPPASTSSAAVFASCKQTEGCEARSRANQECDKDQPDIMVLRNAFDDSHGLLRTPEFCRCVRFA